MCAWPCVAVGIIKDNTAGVTPTPTSTSPRDEAVSGEAMRKLIEADWLKYAETLRAARVPLSTKSDAAGGCDGVKDGKYGFHTWLDKDPWWQVDLGETTDIASVVVFNRLDYAPGLHNADNLRVLTSDDAKSWTLRHDNQGKHFGGVGGGGPLVVKFESGQVHARFVRLQVPTEKPMLYHLDEVEVCGFADPKRNLALHRPADQSSLSQWSTIKRRPGDDEGLLYPIADVLANGRKLAHELAQTGVDVAVAQAALTQLEQRWQALGTNASPDATRALYLDARWAVRRLVFSNPLLNFDRLLFVKRFTQEAYPDVCLNHMPWVSRPGGDICVLSSAQSSKLFAELAEPKTLAAARLNLRSVLNRALGPGHVHGIDLWWNGDRVVFGYAKAKQDSPADGWLDRTKSYRLRRTEEPIHIFEASLDGRRLRQLTGGDWSDLDPTYTPSGDIVFVSERCGTSLQCNEYDKDETSCNLYVMKPDGSGIRRMSVNKDGDYLPHTLDDGSITYVRWEYHERSWAFIQSIWTVRPDGTGADAIFKQHFVNPWALEDTRSIPGSRKLVSIAAGHHTLAVGPLVVVDAAKGINEPHGIGIVTPGVKPPEGGMDGVAVPEGGVADGGGFYSTPCALSEKFFLVSYTYGKETDATGYGLYLVDVYGNKELVYRDLAISCFIPIPLRARPRPPVMPEAIDLAQNSADIVLSDASFGSEEIADRIRYLRIAEPIGWPYDNQLGGQRYGEKGPKLINWTPIRILGDVPVEADGSAHFKVPADVAVYFQLLDENRMELRRMRSFISFQPGEKRACAGCHETRGVVARTAKAPLAAAKPPTELIPPLWGDRPVSFLRDIQPILDRHCVECHSGLKPAGGLDFCGGLTDWSRATEQWWGLVPGYGFNRAFETINTAQLVAIAEPNIQDASITPPLAYGAHRSKLIATLDQEPHAQRAKLNATERLTLTMWADANAPYHDRFVNKRAEKKAYDLAADKELAKQITAVHERRCASCHKPSDISRLDWIDLKQPERSLFLSAPLAKSTGGTERCKAIAYQDVTDADYASLRQAVASAVKKAWDFPRRDLQALVEDKKKTLAGVGHSSR
jgi:mono/diheme cytochrome c family protein